MQEYLRCTNSRCGECITREGAKLLGCFPVFGSFYRSLREKIGNVRKGGFLLLSSSFVFVATLGKTYAGQQSRARIIFLEFLI